MSIEKKYKKLSDIEHVLLRPGMYIGSIKPNEQTGFLFNDQQFVYSSYVYNPGFLKLFDEIVSNSVDEHKRNPKLNKIKVTVDIKTGRISVFDNGGIPVQIHKDYNQYVPELIFSSLKTGSNFDDSEDRIVAGTNGVGSTLTNIFSVEFVVKTCDGKKNFEQTYTNNMSVASKPKITERKQSYTEISFVPDFQRFGMTGIDDISYQLIRKRCMDLSATNPSLLVEFNDEKFAFKKFREYVSLYVNDFFYEESQGWQLGIGYSENGFQQVSFVNGVETKDGGRHVDFISNQLSDWLRAEIKRKHKVEVKPSDLKNHVFLFINCTVVNPIFASQTKEKLITEAKDFTTRHEIDVATLKKIFKSEIVESILDWAEKKKLADDRKALRQLNKELDKTKVPKLIDAKSKTGRNNCTLAIFEGDSASSAFRQYRNPQWQGAFPLRGKFMNVMEQTNTKVAQNKEVQSLLAALGLRMGEAPKDLRYGKILIYTDQDHDGMSIAGLLLNFFGKYWPELFTEGRICKVETPLMVAKQGKKTEVFYTEADYKKWSKGRDLKSWEVEYKKGLAALENEEYKQIIQNPKFYAFGGTKSLNDTLETWFGSDSQPRKEAILSEPEENNDIITTDGLF
jgi:DNA topoisomerase-2